MAGPCTISHCENRKAMLGVLLIYSLLLKGATACGRGQPTTPAKYALNVSVECLLSGLSISWKIPSGTGYYTEVNYVCTDRYGKIIAENHYFETNGESHGSFETDASMIQSVIRNGGDCTVYGCHEIYQGFGPSGVFYNHNESCGYTPAATDVWISSTSTSTFINPTSTAVELPASTLWYSSATIILSVAFAPSASSSLKNSASNGDVWISSSTTSISTSTFINPTSTAVELPASTLWYSSATTILSAAFAPSANGDVWISSSTTSTSTSTSTAVELPATILSAAFAPSASSSLRISASNGILTTEEEKVILPTAASSSTHVQLQATTTPAPLRKGYNTTVIIIAVIVLFAFFTLATFLIGIIICSKKKIRVNSRFKNLGIALHMDSGKIDPDYTPIQVEPYIRKCESVGSILEHLTLHKENESKNEEAALQEVFAMHSYVLQPPPPLKPQSDLSRTKNSDSSDYQSSNTSIATTLASPFHVASKEAELNTDVSERSLQSIILATGRKTIACSNMLFEQKQCRACSSSSDDSNYSSQSTVSSQGTKDCFRLPDEITSSYDLDNLILSKPDEESFQDNRIVLTFSSSLGIEPESTDSDTLSEDSIQEEAQRHSEKMEDSLAKMNLTINPHHFDPL